MNQSKTVLIVEDDVELANILGKSFTIRGYQARIANSTKEAIEDLEKIHPDYAVVDLKMPGDSGLECIKQINKFNQKIKIVMLTGYASITTTIEAIKLGATFLG
jgi:two-component system response regulator RegA